MKKEEKDEVAPVVVSKQAKEFTDKSSKLNVAQSRIIDAQAQFREVVKAKNKESDPEKTKLLLEEMTEIAKKRNKEVESYSSLRQDLLYRYPSMGDDLNRQYRTHEKKTIEELESASNLEDLLERARAIMDKKYAPFDEKDEKGAPLPKKKPAVKAEPPKKLKLVK
jgi:hypothetical protein